MDVQRFWEIVIFSWITGNSDMHCKNFSLIDEKGIGETFIKAMTESGIGEKVAAKIISRLCACESAWSEVIDSSFLSDNLKREYKSLIHSRLVQLI